MPRFAETLQQMVFFLFGRNPRKNGLTGPLGSGVFIGLKRQNGLPAILGTTAVHTYAVTAHHVLLSGGHFIRINTRDGGSRLIETEPAEWVFDPSGSDVAVLDVTDLVDSRADETSWVPYILLADKAFLQKVNFGIGEDGIMLGLLTDQPGKNRNLVACRSGNVTLLSSDEDPIRQPNNRVRPSHLFDIRSRPGFSGSPVFVYRTRDANLRFATAAGPDALARWHITKTIRRDDDEDNIDSFIMLLGLHAGQYHDNVKMRKVEPAEATAIFSGDDVYIPNSVAIVAPVWDITLLFEHPQLVAQRKAREKQDAERDGWEARQ